MIGIDLSLHVFFLGWKYFGLPIFIMRRAKRAALILFSLVFQEKRTPLHIGSQTRVGRLELPALFVCVCVYACVSQHLSGHICPTALNVYGTKASPPRRVLCTHKWQPTFLDLVSL